MGQRHDEPELFRYGLHWLGDGTGSEVSSFRPCRCAFLLFSFTDEIGQTGLFLVRLDDYWLVAHSSRLGTDAG
jgi:hypothetical protein